MRSRCLAAGGLAVLFGVAAGTAEAQRFPGFGGVEARVGVVMPDDASTGLSTSVDVDLGYFGIPYLRPVLGFNHIQANVSLVDPPGAQPAVGSFSAFGGRLGGRLDFFGVLGVRPYALAAVTAHNVTVDADQPADRARIDRVFGGFLVGASLGAGVGYALDAPQQFLATGELRRVWNANVPHWAAEIGIRIVPRGRAAYDRVFAFSRDPWAAEAAARAAAEAERVRRLEAERARTDRGLAEAREAERRAEQERLAQMTDEERRRTTELAVEAERRAEQEAAARAEAEAEAARARAAAEQALTAAEAAEQRALDAEARLYQALVDLDRLVADITEIRETERGLTIVLGQGLFAPGQASLSPRAREEVERIAAVLLQYPQYRILVEGHTDSTGSLDLNQRLSEQRATAVRAALVVQGIAPDRVEMRGFGPTLPIADNDTAAGRAQNRRVEIVLLGSQRPAGTIRP